MRVKDKEIPVHMKAELRKSKVNLNPGMENAYPIFNFVQKKFLVDIASCSNVVLGKDEEELDANLTAIYAREKTQAALFEAEQRKQKMTEEPVEDKDDDEGDLLDEGGLEDSLQDEVEKSCKRLRLKKIQGGQGRKRRMGVWGGKHIRHDDPILECEGG